MSMPKARTNRPSPVRPPSQPIRSVVSPAIHRYARGTTGPPATPDWGLVRRPLSDAGRPLGPSIDSRMGHRFGHDFSHVRVHDDDAAEASTRAVGAEAFTVGHHLVFGHGRYAPGTSDGDRLLAHELTHVVQQASRPIATGPLPVVSSDASSEREARALGTRRPDGTGVQQIAAPALQRSPLSDSVKAAWVAEPNLEALLARLRRPDVRGVKDPDVDAELGRLLAGRPDDLWVAQQIRSGELGQTTGQRGIPDFGKPKPIKVSYVRGTTTERALVIAGVHGTEQQGIEVAETLLRDLQSQQPRFTVIVVPSLFPHADAAGVREVPLDKGGTPTNRNFPPADQDLGAARTAGRGTAVDAQKRPILQENVMLLELIERFHPKRIISIHGTHAEGAAGVFFDPRNLDAGEVIAEVAGRAKAAVFGPPEQPRPGETFLDMQWRLLKESAAARRQAAVDRDQRLSEQAATAIDTATQGVAGRDRRNLLNRETDPPAARIPKAQQQARSAHPSVAGNVGPTGALDHATWSGGTPGGVSLGGYAPQRGISVFTVEPPVNATSDKYGTQKGAAEAGRISQADRLIELQAYADAVRTVLLGT